LLYYLGCEVSKVCTTVQKLGQIVHNDVPFF
jgi:hypothetical protein